VEEVEALPVAEALPEAVAGTPAVGEVEASPVAAVPAPVAVEVVAGTTNPMAQCIC
jgi:hypothetical protein